MAAYIADALTACFCLPSTDAGPLSVSIRKQPAATSVAAGCFSLFFETAGRSQAAAQDHGRPCARSSSAPEPHRLCVRRSPGLLHRGRLRSPRSGRQNGPKAVLIRDNTAFRAPGSQPLPTQLPAPYTHFPRDNLHASDGRKDAGCAPHAACARHHARRRITKHTFFLRFGYGAPLLRFLLQDPGRTPARTILQRTELTVLIVAFRREQKARRRLGGQHQK